MTFKIIAFFLTFICASASKGASLMVVDDKVYSTQNGFLAISQWFGSESPKGILNVYFQNDSQYYPEIIIAAPFGQELRAQLYEGVVLYRFGSETTVPSMDLVVGAHAPDPLMLGMFNVLEIEWAPNGRPLKAAVDWQITNAGTPSYGSLRYNSDIPVSPVPEPSVSILGLISLGLVAWRKR